MYIYILIVVLFIIICQQDTIHRYKFVNKRSKNNYVDYTAFQKYDRKHNQYTDYDMMPFELYHYLYLLNSKSPGCARATTEDSCIYMLGCSWCTWNELGCIYKDIADLLPTQVFCESAGEIRGGQPRARDLFLFKYGRSLPPSVSLK